jgi:hypothetical protein
VSSAVVVVDDESVVVVVAGAAGAVGVAGPDNASAGGAPTISMTTAGAGAFGTAGDFAF